MGAATRTICAIMTGCEKILRELADTFVIADTGNGIDRGAAQVFETCVRGQVVDNRRSSQFALLFDAFYKGNGP